MLRVCLMFPVSLCEFVSIALHLTLIVELVNHPEVPLRNTPWVVFHFDVIDVDVGLFHENHSSATALLAAIWFWVTGEFRISYVDCGEDSCTCAISTDCSCVVSVAVNTKSEVGINQSWSRKIDCQNV